MAVMLMSVSDERFIDGATEKDNRKKTCTGVGEQSTSTRDEMIRFLNRVLDRNKPLFVFNSKASGNDAFGDTGTPSFSMIALIEKT